MRWAFFAGVLLVLLLLPLNRWLAGRIQAASAAMMAHKDARMGAMRQLLGGMRAVKMYAWEQVFEAKVGDSLSARLQAAAASCAILGGGCASRSTRLGMGQAMPAAP